MFEFKTGAKVRISEQTAKFYLDFFKREYIMNPKS